MSSTELKVILMFNVMSLVLTNGNALFQGWYMTFDRALVKWETIKRKMQASKKSKRGSSKCRNIDEQKIEKTNFGLLSACRNRVFL